MPNAVTIAELAKIVGLPVQKLRAIHDRLGRPGEQPRRKGSRTRIIIDSAAWIDAYAGRPSEAGREHARLKAAQADLMELRLEKARGDVVCIAEWQSLWHPYFDRLRAGFERCCPGCVDKIKNAMEDAESERRNRQRSGDEAIVRTDGPALNGRPRACG